MQLFEGKREALENGFVGSVYKPGNLAIAFYNGMWAYDGWSVVHTAGIASKWRIFRLLTRIYCTNIASVNAEIASINV